jgi:hypothetical protein
MCVLPSGSVGRDPTDGADLDGAAPAHGVTAMAGSRMAGSARHSATGTTTGGRLELATPLTGAPPGDPENAQMRSQSMIRKSGYRFSEKIMLKQKDRVG